MSYRTIDQLTQDALFGGRTRAVATEQSEFFKDDQRPQFVSAAEEVMRGGPLIVGTLIRLGAAGPGIADKVDNGDGTIDQAKVTDADLLSLTQANWPVAAGLYFDAEGQPLP